MLELWSWEAGSGTGSWLPAGPAQWTKEEGDDGIRENKSGYSLDLGLGSPEPPSPCRRGGPSGAFSCTKRRPLHYHRSCHLGLRRAPSQQRFFIGLSWVLRLQRSAAVRRRRRAGSHFSTWSVPAQAPTGLSAGVALGDLAAESSISAINGGAELREGMPRSYKVRLTFQRRLSSLAALALLKETPYIKRLIKSLIAFFGEFEPKSKLRNFHTKPKPRRLSKTLVG
ncbi:unnamed protein product [Cuscuta epithymum]|uniref:Uncharacterized protein n=1 Tax=Cuscuta epithymum TaxID=186058 RepID=A0AAV0D878_9ASTE|nr:unnamed protein product [Cuscuta epithymum]